MSKRNQWANKIEQGSQSGKSAKMWCNENQLVYTTFLGWCKRLKSDQIVDTPVDKSFSKTQSIELKEESKDSGISLECRGVFIHLSAEFDPTALKKCIEALKGATC